MVKTITQMTVDGYKAHQTDFATQLSLSDSQVQLDFETEIIQPILAVLSSSDQTAVLTITGHADRVDTEGLTREQRRQQEFEASQARSDSADQGVKEIIRSRFLGFVPADLDELQQLAILPRPAGAAVLREASDMLTEEQRKRNRRVQFRVVRFQPS